MLDLTTDIMQKLPSAGVKAVKLSDETKNQNQN